MNSHLSQGIAHARAPYFCLVGLDRGLAGVAHGQMKLSTKPAPGANETRYFTAIDGLMDGNADVILKETRQGKTVTSAVLDVCYPAAKGSDRKDRFVVNLAVNGQTLTGTTQSIGGKLPVTVKLTRKPTGDNFEFKGQISIGQTVTEVNSTDNSDLSEREFQENQTSDDGITPQPKDFTEVSPESIGVRVKLDAAAEFLKSLKGQDVEVSLSSLAVTCDALRAGEQTITLSADPDRAAALIAKFKSGAGRGRGRLDHRHRRNGPHHPLFGRRLARRRPAQQGKTRSDDRQRAGRRAFGQARDLGLELRQRQAETDIQAAKPALSRARPHRHHRGHGAGCFRKNPADRTG